MSRSPTTSAISDPLAIPSILNLRDAGGLATATGGRVRTGLLYRSAGLAAMDPADAPAFAALGVRTVFDLRLAQEQAQAPDRLPAGTRHVPSDVLASWTGEGPTRLGEWFRDPVQAREHLADGRAVRLWEDQYRAFVRLPSAVSVYGSLLRDLAADATRPALVHCTTGKDRTGWAVALLQRLLDVPEPEVMAHYLESRERIGAIVEPVLAQFAALGGDPAWFRPVFDVRESYLAAAFDEVRSGWGSLERYVEDALGLDARTLGRLRAVFVA